MAAEKVVEMKAKHAHGLSARVVENIASGKIDEFDVLFLDSDSDNPKVGWVDRNKKPIIPKDFVMTVEELPTENGQLNVIYLFDDKSYIWNGEKCIPLSESVDLSGIENELSKKVSAEELEARLAEFEEVSYLISHKPEGTIVDYRDKEIRILCPVDTKWEVQQSGENADPNKYYIGMKAYAPNDDIVSFKEDLNKSIIDQTIHTFDGEFAGVESDGKKYSIIWLPVAVRDPETSEWTYYGASSSEEKYIGWHYSVEWYNASGNMVASDCIRINVTNESCHSSIEPFYVSNAIKTVKDYADQMIEEKISEVSSVQIFEF